MTDIVELMARAISKVRHEHDDREYGGEFYAEMDIDAVQAALRALTEAGWRVVPEDTTAEMDAAGNKAALPAHVPIWDIWDAMLSAAPKVLP